MTLRDTVADISISVTCSRQVFDSPQPADGRGRLGRGARQAVVLRQPRHALALRPRDPDGRPRRAAGPHRATPPAARRRGAVRGRAQAAAAVPARHGRPGHRAATAPPSATCWRTPGAAGRRCGSGPSRRRAGHQLGRRGDRGARPARPRPRGRRDRDRPRRRLGRGPAAVLRRGAAPRGLRAARTPVVSAIGHEPDSPLLDLVADVRASTPTDAAKLVVPDVAEELDPRRAPARPRTSACCGAWLAREQQRSRHGARPARRSPTRAAVSRDRAREVDALRDRARRTLHHQLDRAANDLGHQLARVRGLSPLATLQRGYAVVQDADGHVVTSVGAGRPSRPRCRCGCTTAGIAVMVTGTTLEPRPTRRRPTMSEPATETGTGTEPSYEEAREELVEVVRRLESGGTRPRGVAGAVGARREARADLPGLARRGEEAARRRHRQGRRPGRGAPPTRRSVGRQRSDAASRPARPRHVVPDHERGGAAVATDERQVAAGVGVRRPGHPATCTGSPFVG